MVYKAQRAERPAKWLRTRCVNHILRSWSLRCRWHEEATPQRLPTGTERSFHTLQDYRASASESAGVDTSSRRRVCLEGRLMMLVSWCMETVPQFILVVPTNVR